MHDGSSWQLTFEFTRGFYEGGGGGDYDKKIIYQKSNVVQSTRLIKKSYVIWVYKIERINLLRLDKMYVVISLLLLFIWIFRQKR